jgi:hypothetical protein
VRDGRLLLSFPYKKAEEFPEHPALVSSLAESNGKACDVSFCTSGDLHSGDRIVLVTDAAARMALLSFERENSVFERFLELVGKPAEFERLIEDYRADGRIQNDDIAAVIIRVP